ncbi:VOC family protein [Pleurocapsa sp. FMAR1]|uniref:VOC family protein n=1 Tax=Pleurocapsa sp. FMAR1 TaxID=3040204 RepID=UPI0029C72F3A|nr:VOC family protein [Pleurocapsa sp. FMAR1]
MTISTQTDDVQVQKVRAIGSTVSDAERSLKFYTEAFSFKLVSDITLEESYYSELEGIKATKIRLVTLQLGDEVIELIEYLDIEGKPIPTDSQSNDLWFQHLAIVVSDIDRAYDHVKSFEIEPISSGLQTLPNGIRAFKFKDPDGHDLEIIWFPPELSKDKWQQNTEELFLGIDHSAIAVADTEQSLKFYRDLLGMEVEESNINSGEIQAHLDGLAEAKVRVTGTRPKKKGLGIELLDYIVPGTGRPFADDWQSYDIASMQVQLVVKDIDLAVNTLRENGVEIISPKIIQFPNSYPYSQACIVKDPNGHAMMLITV